MTVLPWLSGCEEINIYSLLKDSIWAYKEQFLADEQLIAELIKNPNFSRLALHDVYPDGKNIGGDKDQLSHLGNSWENLMIFDPFGIEIVSSQKYGIVFIRDDQEKSGPGPWPELAVPPYRVKVDIYMQH
ncbi:MAG: hypothetical protein H6581_10780 [Bacteroidia bacterium]|nr:hypothetical protein [Bacteroidia bacterium]